MKAEVMFYWDQMIPYMLMVLPIIIISRIVIGIYQKKRGGRISILHEIGVVIFLLYLTGLLSQALLTNYAYEGVMRVNLIPFNKLLEIRNALGGGNRAYVLIEVIGNIVLFSGIGFLLPLLWKKCERLGSTLMWCFIISLFIELAQLFLPRATDVDDLIMNTLGGFLGFIVYMILRWILPKTMRRFKNYPIEEKEVLD